MNPSDKRKSEYRKMKAAFEWNDWPVPTPQSFHHWTLARQVDHLITAREAEPDLGFMVRLMALCSLPRTNPGRRIQYKRVNGPYTLIMTATGNAKLPYGNLPRLLMAWVSTEAVRTQRRELILGRSLSEFMRKLDITSTSGGTRGDRTRLRNQMKRLFNTHVQLVHEHEHGERFAPARISPGSTPVTVLRGICGVYFHELPPGPLCLVLELIAEDAPGLSSNLTIQALLVQTLRGHAFDVQFLDGDPAMLPDDSGCLPMARIPVPDFLPVAEPGQLTDPLLSAVRPLLASGDPSLLPPDLRPVSPVPFDPFPSGQNRPLANSKINAHRRRAFRQRSIRNAFSSPSGRGRAGNSRIVGNPLILIAYPRLRFFTIVVFGSTKSMVSIRAMGLNRGWPGFSPALHRRKNAW